MKDVIQVRFEKDFLTEQSIFKKSGGILPTFLKYRHVIPLL